jgi:hypothetical protein
MLSPLARCDVIDKLSFSYIEAGAAAEMEKKFFARK